MRVGVVGTTGYTAAELIRWLILHPEVELAQVVSSSRPGVALSELHPGLLGLTELVTTPFEPASLAELDAVLLGVPHGAAKGLVTELDAAGAKRIWTSPVITVMPRGGLMGWRNGGHLSFKARNGSQFPGVSLPRFRWPAHLLSLQGGSADQFGRWLLRVRLD